MKPKLLLIIPVFTAVALLIYFFTTKSSSSNLAKRVELEQIDLLTSDESTLKQTDGPAARFRHEYIKIIDPATKTVPIERLQMAEELTTLQSMTSRTEASNIVWQERGPSNVGGRTRAILIDKSDATGNTVWAGGVSGGLWKTTNFKTTCTWTQVAGISANLAITCIAQHPSSFGTIYVGTGEGFGNLDAVRGLGVYLTTNGGTNWGLIPSTTTGGTNANDFFYVQKLLVYTNGDVYAACRSIFCNRGGVMKSTNSGSTWTRVLGVSGGTCPTSTDIRAFDIERSASGDLYASTTDGTTGLGKVWRSPAGATVGNAGTWTNVSPTGTFQRIELACSPTNNLKVYALTQGAGSGTGGTRLTVDGGANWTTINVGSWCDQGNANSDFTRGQAWYDLILGIKPTDDATVYAGGVDIFKTINSGSAWSQITQWASGCPIGGPGQLPYVHADIHAFEFFGPDEFVVGCDGGLFYTTNGGASFVDKNNGYNITQYYGNAIHPTSGSVYLLGGAQDNGSHKFQTSGINAVTTVTGGDGAFCHIDADNPLYQFTGYTGCTINRSTNGGNSFNLVVNVGADRFINPSDYDDVTNIMYTGAGARNLYRFSNMTGAISGVQYSNIASTVNHSVSAIKVDPNGIDRVWVAYSTADGAAAFATPELVYIDLASTASPTITTATLPAGIATSGNYISSMDVEPGNSAHIILTLANYGVNSVWESTNTGASWTSIENGSSLPDMPVRWCKFMPAGLSPNTRTQAVGGVLLATETGVWSTNLIAGGATVWVANNTGMGNVRTDMIEIRTSDSKIAVATHGRGMFTGTHASLLPVTMTEFKGTLQNNNKSALLQWTTTAEINSKHFELEKSFDGVNYRKIATIAAAGNSNSTNNYYHTDNEPLTEVNYYRLRSVDIDNASKLSSVVLLKIPGAAQGILVMGNPFQDNLVVRFIKSPATKTELKLFDISGRLIISQSFAAGTQLAQLKVPGTVAKGTYIIKATVDGTEFTTRVIKN